MIGFIITSSAILFIMWIMLTEAAEKIRSKKWPSFLKPFVYLFGVCFLIMDVFFNFTTATIIFLQWPTLDEATLSERLRLILATQPTTSWRWKLAHLICRKLISPWDYNHCRMGLGNK